MLLRNSNANGRERSTYPWWLEEASLAGLSAPPSEPLIGAHEADVGIVGGGYTGLWTALTLKERVPDLHVALLEGTACGAGASGRNGGIFHGYWEQFHRLRATLGVSRALKVCEAGSRANDAIAEFVRASGEDVWLEQAGFVLVATSRAQDSTLEHAIIAGDDLPAGKRPVVLARDELKSICVSPAMRRAVMFPEGGTLHPGRLVHALKRAALRAGVEIYESSPVDQVCAGDPCTLDTPLGRLRCAQVVLATNAHLSSRRSQSRWLTNIGAFAVLTEPIPEYLQSVNLTTGHAFRDGRMFLHWWRTTRDNRLLMGTGSGPMSYGGRVDARHTNDRPTIQRAEQALARLFPDIGPVKITNSWGGAVDLSADRIPFFGTEMGTRIHFAAGYSGQGVNPCWIGGQALASLVLGDGEWCNSPFCEREIPRFPPEPFRYAGGRAVQSAILACEDALDVGKKAPPLARAVASLPGLFGIQVGTR